MRTYLGLVMLLISGQVCHLALLNAVCSLTIVQYVPTFVLNIVLVFLSLRATQFLKL